MLVVVLAFSMFACNKSDNSTDSGDKGSTTDGGNDSNGSGFNSSTKKISDVHYTAPAVGKMTSADAKAETNALVTKISAEFGVEGYDFFDEEPETVDMILYFINQAGITKDSIKKVVAAIDTLWESKGKAISKEVMDKLDSEEDVDIYALIKSYLTAENIQAVLTCLNAILSEINANNAIAVGLALAKMESFDLYGEYDYDFAKVDNMFADSGLKVSDFADPIANEISKKIASDEAAYIVDTVLNMVKNLTKTDAAKLAEAGKIIVNLLVSLDEVDYNIASAISSTGIGKVSFKDLIKVVNIAGEILENMLAAVNDAELGKAINSFIAGNEYANIRLLTSHPEMLRIVASLLKNLTAAQVTDIYLDFSDWQSKADQDDDQAIDIAFAVLIADVVNLVKGEYSKLSTDAKTDISTFLGDKNLYKDAEALIAMIPADKNSIDATLALSISDKLYEMAGKIDVNVYADDDEEEEQDESKIDWVYRASVDTWRSKNKSITIAKGADKATVKQTIFDEYKHQSWWSDEGSGAEWTMEVHTIKYDVANLFSHTSYPDLTFNQFDVVLDTSVAGDRIALVVFTYEGVQYKAPVVVTIK
jgi:hypothetical protein